MGVLCWAPSKSKKTTEDELLAELVCELAVAAGFWLRRIGCFVEKIFAVCGREATLVSITGASQDGADLTILASCGPNAYAAPPGRVLASPWPAAAANDSSVSWSARASISHKRWTPLSWKSGCPEGRLPDDWHQLLSQTQLSEALSLQAQLEPLVLGGRLVGALLVVTHAGHVPRSRSAGGPSVPTGPKGGEPLGEVAPSAKPGSSWSLRRLWRWSASSASSSGSSSSSRAPSPGLMRALAFSLPQVAFGPHLRAVSMICTATQSIQASVSLLEVSRVLSTSLSEALAAEFHTNLAVRVAVVPPLHCSQGYLLALECQAGSGGRLAPRFGAESGPLQRSASSSTPEPLPLAAIGKGGAPAATAACAPARATQYPHSFFRREDSFVGASPASVPNVLLLGSSSLVPKADNKVSPFSLSSSLLLQLLRPGGPAKNAGGGTASSLVPGDGAGEEPLARSALALKPSESTATPPSLAESCQPVPCDFFRSESVLGAARNSTASGMQAHGGASSTTAACSSSSCVSGLVVANLNAWMQDVERPSSDVALLMVAARGKGGAGGAGTAMPGGGGSAATAGSGPACLVAVAGCAAARPQQGNGGAVGAVTRNTLEDLGSRFMQVVPQASDSTPRLPVESFGGFGVGAVDAAAHITGSVSGKGSARYDGGNGGVGCGPCVALYITAAERLPTSLLRAIKDRAVALLELLLPACLDALTAGPIREQLELLAEQASSSSASTFAATIAAGASRSKQPPASLQTALSAPSCGNSGGGGDAGVSGSATPPHRLPSPACSFPSQLHLPPALAGLAAASPLNSLVVIEERSQLLTPGQRLINTLVANRGSQSLLAPATDAPRRMLSLMGSVELAKSTDAMVVAGQGFVVNGSQLFASTSAAGTEISMIAQQIGPGAAGVSGGIGAAALNGASSPSPLSRAMRDTGCGFVPGEYVSSGGYAALAGLMEPVPGGVNDQLSSMRDNLDVWVNSFLGMLKETPASAGHMHGSYADDDLRFLRLYQRLGSGGAASVYAGVLLGMDVAVKVIEPPPEIDMEALASTRPRGFSTTSNCDVKSGDEKDLGAQITSLAVAVRQAQMRELVRSARECAVLTSLSHPSIVQVHSYHTRVAVLPGEGPDDLPRLLPVAPGETCPEAQQGPLHLVIVMERCDLGSLADALDSGMFRKAIIAAANAPPGPGAALARRPAPLPGVAPASASGITPMRAIYLTLLEVALALRYLHSMNLVHCDVKVANVLLKSCASDVRGFTCKLSDFGLVNLLRSEEEAHEQEGGEEGQQPAGGRKPWMRNSETAGTVTHLAPECFEPDSQLDQSVDIYAFGIVMWEVFTRRPPYAEFAPTFEDLPCRVMEGLRPRFPTHCPAHYRSLAQACWSADPAQRPTAAAVVSWLQSFMEGTQTGYEQVRKRQAGPASSRGIAAG